MLNRLLAFLGVDAVQFRALVKTSIKVDVFTSMMAGQAGGTRKTYWHPAFTAMLVYGFMSIFLSAMVLAVPAPFFSAMTVISIAMFLVASMILLEYHSVVISPDDFEILAYRPVDSRTFFWSRIANVLFYTLILTFAVGFLPTLAFTVDLYNGPAFRPQVSLVFFLMLCTSTVVMAITAVLGYAVLIAYMHPRRLRSWLGYIQMLATFAFMSMFFILPNLIQDESRIQETLEGLKTWWFLIYPPTWYASAVELSNGSFSLMDGVSTLLGLGALVLLLRLATGSISMQYSEKLALLHSQSDPAETVNTTSKPTAWNNPERFVVWTLLKRHFINDQKLKMAVLSMVPLIGFYLVMSLSMGTVSDPFSANDPPPGDQSNILVLALFLLPATIKMNMSRSDHYKASWMFFTTPATRANLVVALKNIVVKIMLLPLIALYILIYSIFFESMSHVVMHMVVMSLMAYMFLQIGFIVDPALPFSLPYKKGERFNAIIFLSIMLPMLVTFLGMLFIRNIIYSDTIRYALFVIFLLGLAVFMEWTLRFRITNASKALHYID